MHDPTQPIPEGNAGFQTTRWSMVVNAGNSLGPDVQGEALERLCHDYWFPLYAYLRRSGKGKEDAQDLTQGFFESFLRRKDFKRADPDKGRFRSYLLTALKNYVANEWRREGAARRGGGRVEFSIDADPEERYVREPVESFTPESLYQRSWATSLLAIVGNKLEGEFAQGGKAELFSSLKQHLAGAKMGGESYEAISARHNVSVGAVTMAVQRMRRRYGEILREEIAETVASREEVDEEIRFLKSVLAVH